MSEVVEFKKPGRRKKPDQEWASDEAICVGCRHRWVAVSPIGTRWLECPGCGAMKGVYYKPFGATEGDNVYTCDCGSEAMTAYRSRGLFYFRCMSCGIDHTEAIFRLALSAAA